VKTTQKGNYMGIFSKFGTRIWSVLNSGWTEVGTKQITQLLLQNRNNPGRMSSKNLNKTYNKSYRMDITFETPLCYLQHDIHLKTYQGEEETLSKSMINDPKSNYPPTPRK